MKITKIAYEQLFPTGVYQNQRLYAEASIDDMEIPSECYLRLQKIVSDAFVLMNPNVVWDDSSQGENLSQPSTEEPQFDRIQAFIDLINSKYQTKTSLEGYKTKIDEVGSSQLTEAYNQRLKELSIPHKV